LKETFRFARGTRRVEGEEESEARRVVAGGVWNEQVVRSVGCNRQPIAAVRRGAVYSILQEVGLRTGGLRERLSRWGGLMLIKLPINLGAERRA
jgi:hypothetical protein